MLRTGLVAAVLILALVNSPAPATAEPSFGLSTNNQIFSFDSATPGTISPLVPVTGLLPGTTLVGIDFRPATPGVLVGVGQQASGAGAVYTINTVTGTATQINSITALNGAAYGVDFNPVPNALRIVSDAEQNLRIVGGGTGVVNSDAALNFPGNPTANPNVVGAAYSNNVAGALQTTLYDIDSVLDQLFTQGGLNIPPGTPSPNTGQLLPVGALGVNTSDLVGFDISGSTGLAFASLTPPTGAGSSLYTINLATGAATLVGAIDGGSLLVRDISVVTVPFPATLALFGAGALVLGVVSRRGKRSGSSSPSR